MSKIPLTRRLASDAQAEKIRKAVRAATSDRASSETRRLAAPEDAPALLIFLSDPAVHAPIYSLPRPLGLANVEAFIARHQVEREAGEGLLVLDWDDQGRVIGYSDYQVWPHWAAGELGGAIHPDLQNAGQGARGAKEAFDWMFEALHLELICETAAPDNIRTARLLDGLGFTRMGEVTSHFDDGEARSSLVWEVTRAAWLARWQDSAQ